MYAFEYAVPSSMKRYKDIQDKRTTVISAQMEDSFIFWEKRKMLLVYLFPLILAGLGFLLSKHPIGAAIGFVLGFGLPNVMISMAKRQRLKKFRSQLVDSLMILSSSLKAGLSFLQAIEVLIEEMPPPISQEFNLILGENKLGLSLEESFNKMRARIPIEEVNLIVSSILIARETGGDLPRVLSRLTNTIRDNLKLKEKISTLTLQGRLQGIIMIMLPIAFAYFVYKKNPGHFDVMLQTELGRKLLFLAAALEIVGIILIKRISTMKF
jgi:tight adherence protein B